MQFKNTPTRYGLVAITLHWLVALTVIDIAERLVNARPDRAGAAHQA